MINTNIGFIGAGNMASAIIGGLVSIGVNGKQISIFDPNEDHCQRLIEQHGITVSPSNDALIQNCDVVVLAIKPQIMEAVLTPLSATIKQRQPLLISVAAGISCAHMENWLGGKAAIVRVMPNTPALVNAGASGLFANTHVSASQKTLATELLQAVGTTAWVDNEEDIDAVTALSGSGPAYFMLFIQSLIESATAAGLKPDTAKQLALQTCQGTAKLIESSDVDIAQLIRNVTSPNGTTEAAMNYFADHQLAETVSHAFVAALLRSKQLGEEMR